LIEKNGFGKNIGFGAHLTISKIRHHAEKIIFNQNLRKKMNKIGPKLIDGKGTERIVNILQNQII